MIWLFFAMLATAAMWLTWGLVFVGLGSLVSRLCGQKIVTWEDVLINFWVGLIITLGLLQLWHLALPIDEGAGLCIGSLGLIGYALHIGEIAALLRRWPRRSKPFMVVGSSWIVFVLWLANRALNLPLDADSPFYHLSLIEWQRRFAIVPGLANLMEPFIYNNTSFLYATMLDNGFWRYHGYHFVNTLLMVVVSALLALYTFRWLTRPTFSYEYALAPLLAGLLIMLTLAGSISSPSSDYMVFFLAIVVFFQYILHLRETADTARERYRIFVISLICFASLTVKFSLLPFFALIGLLTLGRWLWRIRRGQAAFSWRLILAMLASLLFLGIPWVIRSFILSGYAAFPFTAVSLPVDWRVPDEIVAKITRSIRIVGFDDHIPESVLAVWTWVPRWLQGNGSDIFFVKLPALWMIVLSGVRIGAGFRGRWSRSTYTLWWLVPPLVALIVWFFNAPQVKYASGVIWVFMAAATIVALNGWQISLRWKKIAVIGAAILFAAYPLFLVVRVRIVLTQPGEYYGFYGVKHFDLPYEPFVTRSGLVVWTGSEDCYYNALPCSLLLNENLALRVPSDLAQGFKIDPAP